MKYVFKRNVVEWYIVEAKDEKDAEGRIHAGWEEVVLQNEGDIVLIGREQDTFENSEEEAQ